MARDQGITFLPQLWLYAMGGLFILVVVLMPNGLAGLWDDYVNPWLRGAKRRLMERPPTGTPTVASTITEEVPA